MEQKKPAKGTARPNVPKQSFDKMIMVRYGRGRRAQSAEKVSNDPLHGITLEFIVKQLVDYYGFEQLSNHINIKCFTNNPSVKSSLTFLRKTPWARKKVEDLYLEVINR
jgi:uncharacterized protein (DUF2132 family)